MYVINSVLTNEGTVQANANNIISTAITNNANLIFTGGTNANAINGTGTTTINGSVINTGTIANAVSINASKDLTTNASNITGNIANAGTLILNGGNVHQCLQADPFSWGRLPFCHTASAVPSSF